MQTFREWSWSLSQVSDSEEVEKFGVPDFKLMLKKIETPKGQNWWWKEE